MCNLLSPHVIVNASVPNLGQTFNYRLFWSG